MTKETYEKILNLIVGFGIILLSLVVIVSIGAIIDAIALNNFFTKESGTFVIIVSLFSMVISIIELVLIFKLSKYIMSLIEDKFRTKVNVSEDNIDKTVKPMKFKNTSSDKFKREMNAYDELVKDYQDSFEADQDSFDADYELDETDKMDKMDEDDFDEARRDEDSFIFESHNGTCYRIFGPLNEYKVRNLSTSREVGYYANKNKYISYTGPCGSRTLNVKKWYHEQLDKLK